MPNRALQKELEKGLPSPVYFLWSEEQVFLEEAVSKAIERVVGSNSLDFNYDSFYPSDSPQKIMDTAYTLPFMAQRRLVVLKDYHQLPKSAVKALTLYLKEPSETTCILILSRKSPKPARDISWKVFSLSLSERDIPAWLKRKSSEKGLQMTVSAVNTLIEFVGFDAGLLLMEIDKLLLSGHRKVGEKDIAAAISSVREFTPFELIDAIAAGHKTKAFRILKAALSGNALQAPVILGTLNWHYKQFYTLWRNKGKRPFKMRDKTYKALIRYIPSLDEGKFYNIFRSLHEADLGIKTSGRPAIAMEVLLIKLLQSGAGN